jgi:DNA-binding IclR family transcriptional regulator
MKIDSKKHSAIEKALKILKVFSPYNQELSTNEISGALGYHKATTSRILLLLTKYGFLEQNKQNRKFKLGPSVAILSLSFYRSLENKLVQLAKPYLVELRDSIQEAVVLEVLSGRTTVRAYFVDGPGPLLLTGSAGDRLPINAAAGARSILAHLDPDTWDYYLDSDLPQQTPSTMTDLNQLKKQLRKIKADGIAFDMGELDPDIFAMAAPIFDPEGIPVAAVVVAVLAGHLEKDINSRKAIQLKKTAGRISEKLRIAEG